MFKIESYITPLLMGYVDKYVKLRPDDFQLSLWGGDAVLYNLDLRLDVIEKAIQLPIVFQSGHIHELRLHVPWTKLGSDPVVVTINTIECILKLRDTAYKSGRSSRAGSETPSKSKPGSAQKQKARRQDTEDLPPGYLQSLMNKILNNVTIIVNNLIIKFVEDDIVLSLNVKSAECYSVNKDWNRAFAELTAPDFALRRAINFCDLTVCLDKRDGSGKIDNYQDPLLYRCSLSGRLYTKFESMNAKFPLETKLNLYCEKADLSMTDAQLPMLIRLVEMCIALYYGTIELKIADESSTEPDKQKVEREVDSGQGSSVGEPPPEQLGDAEKQEGWVSWAWSYVPALLPDVEDDGSMETPAMARKRQGPSAFSFGLYAYKLTLTFKLTEYLKEKVHYGPKKIVFKPFLFLESEGIALDILAQGLAFFDAQFGITNLRLYSRGPCICGAEGEEHARNNQLLSGGESLSEKKVNNYICQSLFDQQSPENLGIPVSKIVNFEEHKEVYTEQYGIQKFGVFWLDYLYSMDTKEDTPTHSSRSSVSSIGEQAVFIGENSLMRFLIGQCHLNVSSTTVHRIQKFLNAAYNYNYEPYSKKQEEVVDENRPHPTEEQIQSLESYIPTVTTHVTLLQPIVSILSAEHAYCDINKKSYKSHHSSSGSSQKSKSSQSQKQYPLYGLQLSSQRFDYQVTSPMYPRRLVQMVSKIAGPPSNLMHHCHAHTQMKVFGLMAGITKIDASGGRSPLVTIMPSSSGALYTRRLKLPMYWKNPYLPKLEKIYELPQMTLSISKPGLLVVMAVLSSWNKNNPRPADITADSLMEDTFPSGESDEIPRHTVLELNISGFQMKNTRNDLVTAYSGTLSSVHAVLYKNEGENTSTVPILSIPSNTDPIHTADWLIKEDSPPLEDVNNDCMTFTYQLPRKYDHIEAPAVALLNIEGITGCLDPAIMDWLEYKPKCKVEQAKVELDMELAKAADPLQGNISQVSQPSSGSKRQSLSVTQTITTGTQATEQAAHKEGDQQRDGIAEKLAKIFPLIRVIQVQFEMKKCCLFLPKSHLQLREPSVNIVQNFQTLARSRSLSNVLVLCLPHVHVQSAGLKTTAYLQEIPISSMEGSLVGDKIPWNVSLRNFSIYTVHCGGEGLVKALPVVRPASVSCTVGVSYKYHPPTSDNITALGLCIHSDMHPVKMTLSAEQIKLLSDITTQTVKIATRTLSVMSTLSSSMASDTQKSPQAYTPPIPQSYSPKHPATISATSVTEGDFPYTQTSDITSLDTTPSRELEIMETSTEGVKLSLWLQWTVPKWEVCFYNKMAKEEELKLCVLMEDMTMSVDVQDVYAKLKVKMSAINVSHAYRSSGQTKWEKGPNEGILMSCREELSRDTHIVTSKLWAGEVRHVSTDQSLGSFHGGQGSSRELTHGFLNLTFTRALRKNVKKRLQKYNVEMPQCSENGNTDVTKQFHFFKYVSEVCLILNPCDMVVSMTPIVNILGSITSSDNPKPPKPVHTGKPPGSKVRKQPVPWLNSSNIPLIYADMASVRVFVPGKGADCDQDKTRYSTVRHDMLFMQVQAVRVVPHADNPLPRYALNKELYQRAVQLGITSESGSTLTDRQYQIDIRGFSVCTGVWKEFIKHHPGSKKNVTSPTTQIPAVEWNTYTAMQQKHEEIELFPLVSPCDMKLVAAPAIVNMTPGYGTAQMEKTLICGYSMEFNVVSDLDLHFSTNQIQLLHNITQNTLHELSGSHDKQDNLNEDLDSGIGSDISVKLPSAETSKQDTKQSKKKFSLMTPIDVLLTAGRISSTFYAHKVAEDDIRLVTEKVKTKKSVKKSQSKQELEWRVTPEAEHGENADEFLPDQAQYQDSYFMSMFERKTSVNDDKVIPAGSVYIDPFLFVYISQPSTVVSCHRDTEKFEISCYDILVKGPVDRNSLIQVSEAKSLPDCSDFSQYWLETRPGQPAAATGILPSLFTFTVLDFLQQPANIKLRLERPVKANVSFMKLRQVHDFIAMLVPPQQTDTQESRQFSPKPERRKPTHKAASNIECLRKKPATYEAFQNDIQWAIESVEGELEGHGHPSEKDPGEINRWASNEDVVQLKGHVQPYEKDIGQVDRKTSNDDVVQLEGHVQPFEEDPGQVDREASNDDVKTAPKHIFIYLESSDDEFDQCNVETRNEVKHDTTLPHETVRKRKYISSDSNSDSNNDLTRMKMDKLVPLRKRVKVVPQSDNDSDMSDEFPMLSQTKLKYCPEVNSGADNITINERGIAHPALLETTIRASDSLPRVFAKDMRYEHIYISGVMKSKISNSGQNKKSDRVYNSRHPCPYCKETKSNFSHHILAKKHKNEPEVIEINNAKDENERKYLITKLCLKAAHNHNMQVLEGKRGELFLFRRLNSTDDLESDSDDQDQGRTFDIRNYGPCPSCFGWVKMKSLLRHNRSCTSAAPEWSNRALQVQSDIIAGRLTSEASENLIKEVFPIMYKDDISKVAKEDNLIVNLGNQWLMRNRGNEIMRKYYTSSMMRLSARLKLACQDLSQTELEMTDYLAPVHFETVLKAVLACCHVEEMEENLKAPSNAVKLGFDIKRMLSAKLSQGIMSGDEVKQKEATDFLRLMDLQWSLRVTRLARGLLVERSFNQQNELPRLSDVKRLFEYLQTEIKGLDLTDASFSNFRNVAILSLARITLHNRRRCHEVQAMRLSSYVARKTGIDEVGVEIRGELTKFERQLLMRQEFVVIRGKTGKGVPVIIPPDVVCALKFLSSANIRISAGIPQENKYVFSNKGVGVFRGYDAIREVTQAPDVGLQMPDLIRSSKMRKYMATMLQALNTTEAERQWVVDHLGHTMNVHQVHYRQTSDVLERVDVAKVLLIQDLGLVAKYKGKKIQDIQIQSNFDGSNTLGTAKKVRPIRGSSHPISSFGDIVLLYCTCI